MTAFWKATFNHLDVTLLFITIYHPQADGQSERINQTMEIALRYALMKGDVTDFSKLLPSIQACMNNSANASTKIFLNEILYGFKILETIDLLDNDLAKTRAADDNPVTVVEKERFILKKKTQESINHAQIMIKLRYDLCHKALNLKTGHKVYIRLHKEYTQPRLKSRKYSKQKIGPATILEKMGRFVYKLDIPSS